MYRFLVGGLSDARSMIRARVGLSHTLKRFADDATVRIHNRQEPSRTAVGKDAIAKEFRRLHETPFTGPFELHDIWVNGWPGETGWRGQVD